MKKRVCWNHKKAWKCWDPPKLAREWFWVVLWLPRSEESGRPVSTPAGDRWEPQLRRASSRIEPRTWASETQPGNVCWDTLGLVGRSKDTKSGNELGTPRPHAETEGCAWEKNRNAFTRPSGVRVCEQLGHKLGEGCAYLPFLPLGLCNTWSVLWDALERWRLSQSLFRHVTKASPFLFLAAFQRYDSDLHMWEESSVLKPSVSFPVSLLCLMLLSFKANILLPIKKPGSLDFSWTLLHVWSFMCGWLRILQLAGLWTVSCSYSSSSGSFVNALSEACLPCGTAFSLAFSSFLSIPS